MADTRGSGVDGAVLSFDQLHAALANCMAANPPEGAELRLHPDANRLAGLWGLMSYERRDAVAIGDVSPEVLEAYRRWRPFNG